MGNFLESVRAFIADNPLLQTGLDMGSIIVPFALLYAYFGLTFIAICGEIIALRRKRSAYNKCARQLACLSMLLGWLMLLGGRLWLIMALDGFDSYSIIVLLSEATWMMFGFAAIVSCCYFMLWKFLANYPVLHIVLGAIAFLQGLMTCVGVMAVTRLYNALSLPEASSITIPQLFTPQFGQAYLSALCYTLPLIFALAGGFGAVWLLLRRKADDFGRDYYNTMVPWCTRWARNAWGLLWLLLVASSGLEIWQTWQTTGVFMQQDAIFQSLRVLLWLVPALLWTLVARSATPRPAAVHGLHPALLYGTDPALADTTASVPPFLGGMLAVVRPGR